MSSFETTSGLSRKDGFSGSCCRTHSGGQGAHRRFRLDVDETLVVVDVVDGFGGVYYLPDDDRGDLDRAAVQFVDLELAALEVAHARADFLLG